MKDWKQVKELYIKDHLAKPLKAPNIRLNALARIEEAIREFDHQLLLSDRVFKKYGKVEFSNFYLKLKRKPLSGAEKSVINGLYKFSEE